MTEHQKHTANVLIGASIVDYRECEMGGITYPLIAIRTKSGRMFDVVVQSDEEGNGGGFLALDEIAPAPAPRAKIRRALEWRAIARARLAAHAHFPVCSICRRRHGAEVTHASE